jgi:hypothetical protein
VPTVRLGPFVVASAFVAASGLRVAPARAQGNYRTTPIGGRTTLVGGTGLVYGSDGAAAFLNPATVVRVDPGRLTFAVNFYSVGLLRAPSWYEPGDIDRTRYGDIPKSGASITNASFDALPSSLCIFLRTADIGIFTRKAEAELRARGARIGICFGTTQSRDFAFSAENFSRAGDNFGTRQGQTLTEAYRRFSVGPTYAMNVDDHLSVGASIHASIASYRSLFASAATTYGAGAPPISTGFYAAARGVSFQTTATVGATYRFGGQTLGLALESPSLHVYGSGGANRSNHYEGPADSSSMLIADGSFRSSSPARIALGTGIEDTWGSLELDMSVFLPMQESFRADLDGSVISVNGSQVSDNAVSLPLSARAKGVMNVAAGGQLWLNPRVSVLGGLGTDFSAVPKGGLSRNDFNYLTARANRYYVSFGVGSHGEGGDLMVGAELSYTNGERLALNNYVLPTQLTPTPYGGISAVFVLAGSTSLTSIKRAVKDVKKVLDPDNRK